MSESESEAAHRSSARPPDWRQPENTTRATPKSNGGRNTARSEPEPVPSTSGISSKGKQLVDPKSRFSRRKRDNWEDSIISAFKIIKISGEWNEDDSSDDDFVEEERKKQELEQKKARRFDNEKDENAILELAVNPTDTYPQVYEAEQEPTPSTSFGPALETGTAENEPQPVREEDLVEQVSFARAPAPASPPPQPWRVPPLRGSIMSSTPFHDLRIPREMIRNLRDSLGITIATVVQEKAIPILMQEKDAFLHAVPGAGKTVAIAIPVTHHLLSIKPQVCCEDGIRILVVVPDKECALKTYEIFTAVLKPAPWLVVGLFGGGDHFRTERESMKKGAVVLITTPARFLDHVRRSNNVFLKNLSCLVVEGLDQVFEQGDDKCLMDIITVVEKGVDYLHHPDYLTTPKRERVEASRQTILTSTLITERVACFTGLNTTNLMMIDGRENSPPRLITVPVANSKDVKKVKLPPPLTNQYYMIVPERMKLAAMVGFVMWKFRVAHERRILVFAGTQTMADYFCDLFLLAYGRAEPDFDEEDNPKEFSGMDVYKLCPLMSLNEKINLFMTFCRSKRGILFCSDSAVMGVDLPRVDWVIHLHAPTCISSYMTRIGMANPGLQIGSSLVLLLPSEKAYVQELRGHDIPATGIRLRQSFRHLWGFYPPSHTIDQMMFEIQNYIEEVVHRIPGMRDRACLAVASWCRLYSSYPENLKNMFRISSVHMDNYVHSFGLRGPSSYAIKQARKLHLDARRKQGKKRHASADDEDSSQDSPLQSLSPPPGAQMPSQAAIEMGMEPNEMMFVQAEALEDASAEGESKKRKNVENMEQDDDEGYPEKRSK